METEVITTPSTEGVAEQTASQESVTGSQEQGQTQEAGSTQVESERTQATSAPDETRPKPSEFYRVRKKIQKLEDSLLAATQRIDELISHQSNPAVPAGSSNGEKDLTAKFWETPIEETRRLIKETLEEALPKGLDAHLGKMNHERESQEAANFVLTNELIKKDPEGVSRIEEIIRENDLGLIGEKNPMKAARLALNIYELEQGAKNGKRNPNAPSKGQMSSVASGTGQGSKTISKQEIVAEATKLRGEIASNPALAQDPKTIERLNFLRNSARK